MLAWKLIHANHILGYADGRPLVADETLTDPRDRSGQIATRPILCKQGFHASISPRDCLRYANGATHIARVEIGGEVVCGKDKIAGTTIRCLWIANATQTLRLFAIACRWRQISYQLSGKEPSLAALWALDCAERFVRGEAEEDERRAAAAYAGYATAADAADDAAYAGYAATAADAADDAADDAGATDDEKQLASQNLEEMFLALAQHAEEIT